MEQLKIPSREDLLEIRGKPTPEELDRLQAIIDILVTLYEESDEIKQDAINQELEKKGYGKTSLLELNKVVVEMKRRGIPVELLTNPFMGGSVRFSLLTQV